MAAENSKLDGEGCSSKDLKLEDFKELSNLFSSEFDKSDIHDRVLIFQIIEEDEFEKTKDDNDTWESERRTDSAESTFMSTTSSIFSTESESENGEKSSLKDGNACRS